MISQEIKANAIARLAQAIPPEEVAENLDIPLKLVKEWSDNLSPNNLVSVHANINAMNNLKENEVLGLNEDVLRETLELTAIDIAKSASVSSSYSDPLSAKAVQLCADAVSRLYKTFILKDGMVENTKQTPTESSAFQNLLRD